MDMSACPIWGVMGILTGCDGGTHWVRWGYSLGVMGVLIGRDGVLTGCDGVLTGCDGVLTGCDGGTHWA